VPVNLITAQGPTSASSPDDIDRKTVPNLVLIWILITIIVAFKVRNTIKRMFFYNYS